MIRWSSLLADDQGIIDYARVRSLVSICLALFAGIAAVWVVFIARNINETLVGIMVAACVAPLTGGKIADGIAQRKASQATAKVVSGQSPDRRSSGGIEARVEP